MNDGVNTFVIAAWPAAGKSVATRETIRTLKMSGIEGVTYFSDKIALLNQVEHEILAAGKSLHSTDPVEVANFTLLNPSESRDSWGIQFKQSATLNEAHLRMYESIAQAQKNVNGNRALVVELAYGEDALYPDGPLRQTVTDHLDEFARHGILDTSAFVDIYARLKYRDPRNEGRKKTHGYIPRDQFRKYFGDIGGFSKEDVARLGSRFKQIRNEIIPEWMYRYIVRDTVKRFMLPLTGPEGNRQLAEGHRHAGRVEF